MFNVGSWGSCAAAVTVKWADAELMDVMLELLCSVWVLFSSHAKRSACYQLALKK